MTNVSAHTEIAPHYPGYVNLTKADDGSMTITVRSSPRPDNLCGPTASITISRSDWSKLLAGFANGNGG